MKKGGSAINKVISTMIWSDFLFIGADGFLAPLFPIFVQRNIEGATLETIGYAVTVFWVVKSIVQIPLAKFVDRVEGEKDDFLFMFFGSVLYGLGPLLLFVAKTPMHIYAIQAIMGIFAACFFPTYSAIFTRHIDKHREGFEWSVHSLAVGMGYAGAAALGGVIAQRFGFSFIILMHTFILVSGALILLMAKKDIYADGKGQAFQTRPPNGRRMK